jgi:hypothetical protein
LARAEPTRKQRSPSIRVKLFQILLLFRFIG